MGNKYTDRRFACRICADEVYYSDTVVDYRGLRVCQRCRDIQNPSEYTKYIPRRPLKRDVGQPLLDLANTTYNYSFTITDSDSVEVNFHCGSVERWTVDVAYTPTTLSISNGDTLVGQTSGAVGTVDIIQDDIVVKSGTVAGGDAVLGLVVRSLTGTYTAAETVLLNGTTDIGTINATETQVCNEFGSSV